MSNQDNFDPSLFQKAAALSGFAFTSGGPFSGFIYNAQERERLVTEIAAIANVSTDEVKDFYQSHQFSFEFIETALRAGAKLDEEDIKRTMEERVIYQGLTDLPSLRGIADAIASAAKEAYHTFIVTFPDTDHREVKAAYMEIDGGTLYFENEDHETILAFGSGHWVWAERVEDDQNT